MTPLPRPSSLLDRLAEILDQRGDPRPLDDLAADLLRTGSHEIARRVLLTLLERDDRFRIQGEAISLRPVEGLPEELPLQEAEFAVLDFETNGLAQGERAIEIGVAWYRGGLETWHFETLLNPGTRVAPFVQSLTGIRPEDLEGKPSFEEIWPDLAPLLAGRVLVAHNLPFDARILRQELARIGAHHRPPRSVCTVRLARRLIPTAESKSLDALAERFAFEFAARHRALDDARVTGKVLYRLIDMAAERVPMETIGHLDAFLNAPPPPKKRRPRTSRKGKPAPPQEGGAAEKGAEDNPSE